MDEQRLEILKRCKKDLEFFGKQISPQTFYLPSPEFHREIDQLLMDRSITQLMIEAPRGTGKSTKCIHFVLHHAIFDPEDKVIVIQSKTRREAIRRLTKIKDIIEYGAQFRSLFGYCGEQVALSWREDYIKTKIGVNTVTIIAVGTGQQVRGILEGDTRITLYYLDDPDDEDNTKSKEGMEDNFSKFLGGIAGLDRRRGRVIVVGTPIVEGCIVARLRGSAGWVTKNYAACNEETKECLWEEMYDYQWLMDKKKELDEQGMLWKFYSEYMCQLRGKDDQVFKNEDFRFWDGEFERGVGTEHFLLLKGIYDNLKNPIQLYDNPVRIPILTFIGIDPSFSLNPRADFSVVMTIGVDKDWNIYQFPYIRKRILTSELVEYIIQQHNIYQPFKTTIESGAQQDTVRQMVNHLQTKHIVGLASPVAPPKDSKHKRYIDILQYYHKNHKLFLHLTQSEELKTEMVLHPSVSAHDDTIDALYWAVKRAHTPDHKVPEPKNPNIIFLPRKKKIVNSWMSA